MNRFGHWMVVLVTLALSGCAFTTMDPAHKLEAGEIVAQGALDEPGVLYIPRLSGAVTYGIGGKADIGAHIGTTIINVNAGASVRYYVAERWYAGLQGDVLGTTFQEDLLSSGSRFVIANVTPRFGRLLVDPNEVFYGGFQAQALLPITVENDTDVTLTNQAVFGAGGYLGLAWDSPGNWDWQLELSGTPIGLLRDTEGGPANEPYVVSPLPIVQLGLGLQYRAEKEKGPKPRPSDEADEDRRIR